MPKKGCIRTPDPVTEEVLAVIASIPECLQFKTDDILGRLPLREREQIADVLCSKTRQGSLTRIGRGLYQKGGTRIKSSLPLGLVAEGVWAVLATDPERKFRRLPEIVGDAETYVGRPQVRLYHHVSSILCRWHRSGHLERTGKQREYAYRIKEGVTERPITSTGIQ